MLVKTGYIYLCPLEGSLSIHGYLSLLTLSCGGCSVSEGHCSKKYSLETVSVRPCSNADVCVCVCWVLSVDAVSTGCDEESLLHQNVACLPCLSLRKSIVMFLKVRCVSQT